MLDASGPASAAVERRKASGWRSTRFCTGNGADSGRHAPFGASPPFFVRCVRGVRGLFENRISAALAQSRRGDGKILPVFRHPEVAAKRPSKGDGRGAVAVHPSRLALTREHLRMTENGGVVSHHQLARPRRGVRRYDEIYSAPLTPERMLLSIAIRFRMRPLP